MRNLDQTGEGIVGFEIEGSEVFVRVERLELWGVNGLYLLNCWTLK